MSTPQVEQQLSTLSEGPVEIRIEEEGLSAVLVVSADTVHYPSLKQIHLAIEKAGVIYGIEDQIIDEAIARQSRGIPIVFAHGQLPVQGEDARLIWHLDSRLHPWGQSARELGDDESVIGPVLVPVEKDQRIVSKQPARGGTQGITVLGKSITKQGQDVVLPQGCNTYLSDDGLSLLAEISGIANCSSDTINVLDMNRIKGNVDSQTGSVRFDGPVYIDKDVRSGYKVQAMGDIYIGGNIEGAEIYSRGGSVIVRNGIIGQNKARVLAGRHIVAGFIQDAVIGGKFDVVAERYIINSAITAGRDVVMTTGEGIIRGGTTFAQRNIEIQVAGSADQVATHLKVGYTPPERVSRSRLDLQNELRRNRMELAYVQKRLAFLRLLKKRMGELPEDREDQLRELDSREKVLRNQYYEYSNNPEKVRRNSPGETEEKPGAEIIRVLDTIHPGVSIFIGDVGLEINKARQNLVFFRLGDQIVFGPVNQMAVNKSAES